MTVDISDFPKDGEINVAFESAVKMPKGYPAEEAQVQVTVTGKLLEHNGKYKFKGRVESRFVLPCDKCLEPVRLRTGFNLNETYAYNASGFDSDEFQIYGHIINLAEAVEAGVYSNFPMKVICGEGCLGLCLTCGVNLNNTVCVCNS